jgi:undecaprenyl-diphosphatase
MSFWKFLLLCAVQGVTEVLPISSSGHLVIVNRLLNSTPLSVGMIVLLHTATATVTVFVLSKTIISILHPLIGIPLERLPKLIRPTAAVFSRTSSFKLLTLLALSCLCTVVPVFAVENKIEAFFASSTLVGWALIVNGFVLLTARTLVSGKKTLTEINWGTVCLIGLAQGIGVIPGISRLGITLFAALLCGMLWDDAVVYSLLISIPIILGQAARDVLSGTYNTLFSGLSWGYIIIGLLVIALLALTAIRFLRGRWGQKSLVVFAAWCWILGTATLMTATV